jgi:hypothetical protein
MGRGKGKGKTSLTKEYQIGRAVRSLINGFSEVKMTSKKLTTSDVISSTEYILVLVLEDNSLRFVGQGLKFRNNPLHPIGWKKLTTAKGYAQAWLDLPSMRKDWNIKEIQVCERIAAYDCLSSIAITKQNSEVSKEQNHATT